MREHNYHVYILTNANHTTLYIGVTNDLRRRVSEHKAGKHPGFTQKYNLNKLVYFEHHQDVNAAIAREKQLKGGSRAKKIALIEMNNSDWLDLFDTI
jgi:putative endonuclease